MHLMIIYLLVAIFLIQKSHSTCNNALNCTLPSCDFTIPQDQDSWVLYPCTVERIDATHAQSTLPTNPAPPGYFYSTNGYNMSGYISLIDPSIQLTCTGDGLWSYTSDFGFYYVGGTVSDSTTTFCCYNFLCANCSMHPLPLRNSSSLLQLNGTESFRNTNYNITSLRYTQLSHTSEPFTSLLCEYVFIVYCQVLPSDQNCKFSFLSNMGQIVYDYSFDITTYDSIVWDCGVQPDTEAIMNKTSEIVCICNQ